MPLGGLASCSGGGGRIDLGIPSRTNRVWNRDDTDPLDRLAIQEGFSQIYPARLKSAWGTDSPNVQFSGRVGSLGLRFVSAMAGVLGVGGDLAEWSESPEAWSWTDLCGAVHRGSVLLHQGLLTGLRGTSTRGC